MESKYGYIVYNTDFDTTEINKDGEIIQFIEPAYKGQIDLVDAYMAKRMLNDFPDRIKGSVIEQKALLNIIRLLFEKLEADYNSLSEKDECTREEFNEFKNYFNQMLNLDNSDKVNDMANKFVCLQCEVRKEQIRNKEFGSMASGNYSKR